MMIETVLSRSLRMMFAGGAAVGLSLVAQQALAQSAADEGKMTRVEITGSSIKRIAVEGALPVQTLSKTQIEQSGATTVADLVASLPSMQGFVTSAASINGGGGGIQTASVHGIGSAYTLVLLNGHRIAPYSTGSAVNLASIPLSAVERVEILTDGASALYGSDAIAGVVNFILKKNQQDANIELTYSRPQQSRKGDTSNIAISKGFGDLDKDKFNVLLAYSHDTQSQLEASDREFSADGGVRRFSEAGKNYSLYQLSGNSIPANVTVRRAGQPNVSFNPALITGGNCPAPNTFAVGKRCLFNYAATVQNLPELKRDGFFASGNFIVNDSLKFFGEGLYSKFTSTARYAPPAQPLTVDRSTTLYRQFVEPALVAQGINPADVTSATMNLRLVDAGGRTDAYKTEAKHLVVGAEGDLGKFGYNVSYTHSVNTSTDSAVAGYTSGNMLEKLIAEGKYNPFVAPSAATKAALAPAVLRQELGKTTSKINVLSARGSMGLFEMAGGTAQLGAGADFSRQNYADAPSAIAQGPNSLQPNWTDTNVGGGTGALPFDSSRDSYGVFGELVMPVVKSLEVTLATRYDSYDKVKNSMNFNSAGVIVPGAEQGNTASAVTYKIAAAFRPVESLLLRAGYGTGFKAPTLSDVTLPLVNGGSSGFYACPITSGPLLPLCNGTAEYGLLTGGNANSGDAGLKPEKSKQFSVGVRVEPMKSLSLGLDLWDVKLRDQITTLPENTVFKSPQKFLPLFSSYYDPIQKDNVLVAALTPFNLATSHFQGIDWDHTFRTATPMGKLTFNWTGTYMVKAEKVAEEGSETVHSVGRFDEYNEVVFRVISRLATTWQQSTSLSHSLTWSYRSGYHDAPDEGAIREVLADGSLGGSVSLTRDVKAYSILDWQTKWKFNKNLTLTAGVKNLLDEDPPFSQRIAGGGNYVGYDGRYTDPLGRQFYLVGSYKF